MPKRARWATILIAIAIVAGELCASYFYALHRIEQQRAHQPPVGTSSSP